MTQKRFLHFSFSFVIAHNERIFCAIDTTLEMMLLDEFVKTCFRRFDLEMLWCEL